MEKYLEILRQGCLRGLRIFHNSIGLNWRKIDLDQSTKYCIYVAVFKWMGQIIKYIGKGVIYYNKDGSSNYRTRFLSHKKDAFSKMFNLVGPNNCEIYTLENLTENEAKAMEGWLIQLIEGSTMSYGQYRWRGEKFLNKRCEDINRDLINYYDLDRYNDIESFRRKINDY